MTRPRFYDLLSCVHDELKHSTKRNHALLPSLQLMTGLRFFACGSFQQVIADTLKIDKSRVCRTITRVTKALLKLRNEMIYWPSEEECASIATELCNSHNFPCVKGLIDGTHIKVLRPKEHEAAFVNRKDYHSINVQVCGNGKLMITDVVAKWPGSVRDSRMLKHSNLYERFKENLLPRLPNGVVLGDSGYPLLPWLLVPITEYPAMTAAERRYNDAHKSTRSIVERIIGILKKRWACLKELSFKPGKCCEVIVVCCILHNFCRDLPLHDDDDASDNDNDDDDDDCDCHEEIDETVEGREYRVEFIQSFFS